MHYLYSYFHCVNRTYCNDVYLEIGRVFSAGVSVDESGDNFANDVGDMTDTTEPVNTDDEPTDDGMNSPSSGAIAVRPIITAQKNAEYRVERDRRIGDRRDAQIRRANRDDVGIAVKEPHYSLGRKKRRKREQKRKSQSRDERNAVYPTDAFFVSDTPLL